MTVWQIGCEIATQKISLILSLRWCLFRNFLILRPRSSVKSENNQRHNDWTCGWGKIRSDLKCHYDNPNSIYIIIQTKEKLLEGLLFLGPSGGKYLKEDISAPHVRVSLTSEHINPPLSPHIFFVSYINGLPICVRFGVMLQTDAHSQPNWVYPWWLRGGEILIWGQNCGNWQELPMVAVKSGNLSQRRSFWAAW